MAFSLLPAKRSQYLESMGAGLQIVPMGLLQRYICWVWFFNKAGQAKLQVIKLVKRKGEKKGFYFRTQRLKGFQIANRTNNTKLRLL